MYIIIIIITIIVIIRPCTVQGVHGLCKALIFECEGYRKSGVQGSIHVGNNPRTGLKGIPPPCPSHCSAAKPVP